MSEERKYVCGVHHCEQCGDCMVCFAEDKCYWASDGKHVCVMDDDDDEPSETEMSDDESLIRYGKNATWAMDGCRIKKVPQGKKKDGRS